MVFFSKQRTTIPNCIGTRSPCRKRYLSSRRHFSNSYLDEVAVYLLREYGSNLFLSLADINDIDVQHMVEAALNKMNKRAIDRDSPSKRVFVILDNFEIKAQQ